MGSRHIKQEILALLSLADMNHIRQEIRQYRESDIVSPLFSALSRPEELLRWHAVTVFGQVAPRLADQDLEAARIVMRRFLWSLNDESGGIGWGAPEAMAEIIYHHDRLADEYLHMLISYMQPDGPLEHQDGNFLELPALQSGLLWGIGRLAEKRARDLVRRGVISDLAPYLLSAEGAVRGLAARAIGAVFVGHPHPIPQASVIHQALLTLTADTHQLRLYQHEKIESVTVGELASKALGQLKPILSTPVADSL